MPTSTRFLPAVLAVVVTLAACGGDPVPPPDVDGGSSDLGGSVDLGGSGSDARIVCMSDIDCNDGLFCNGREMCAPASPAADVRGCVPGDAPCSATEMCDEVTNDCRTSCDDVDGDGHTAVACGGDDCADDDATRFPGAAEICDSDDEDCNDTTLGFVDADMDGAGSASCCNGLACGSDCDDTNASIRPGVADGPAMNCNGIDDDCDGVVDVACPCADGERRPCYSGPAGTRTTGICIDGVSICAGGMLGSECIDDILPASEICNELDDDCDGTTDEGVLPRYYRDVDGDGYGQTAMFIDDRCNPPAGYVAAAGDCDDTLPTVHPGEPDLCNGVDDDCDGMIDEGAPQGTYYRDDDRDGYGSASTAVMACSAPMGFVPASGDCDDTLAGISPVGVEVCDSAVPAADENCDTLRNEGCDCVDGTTQPCGGGTPVLGACRAGLQRCIVGAWAGCAGNVDPGTLTETCNGVDDDCDGMTDETLLAASCFADSDSDGYGAGAALATLCRDAARAAFGFCPAGYTDVAGDCNNGIAAINPAAPESCNGIDDNCAGGIDEGVRNTYYRDVDGDGYGSTGMTTLACSVPATYAIAGGDCNDASIAVRPSAPEICNSIDDNCAGGVDEGVTRTFYRDVDGDGFGVTATTTQACTTPVGYADRGGDCNDAAGAANINPVAFERCDGTIDDDCDGIVDDGCACVTGATRVCGPVEVGICRRGVNECLGSTWSTTCTGEITSRVETCNGLDDDCNGAVDNGAGASIGCYADGDSDGAGAGPISQRCPDAARAAFGNCPSGYTNVAGDCNDGTGAVRPGATELCNGIDDNCAGGVDELLTSSGCFVDTDSDGYGSGSSSTQCRDALRGTFGFCPVGYTNVAGDCNTGSAAINPGELELCNGIDDNCVGGIDEGLTASLCYVDGDSDGYGAGSTSTQCRDAGRMAYGYCPIGYTATAGDCNNAIAAINPAAPESCNGIDDNCVGGADEGVRNTYYRDVDGDGYGLTGTTTLACSVPADYAVVGGDCNDTTTAIRPSAAEICNAIDDNCAGGVDEGVTRTFYRDVDGDGFGVTATTTQACTTPVGYADRGGDCNDAAGGANINPVASERCDGTVDDDCDGIVDDGCACTTGTTRPCGPAAVGICRPGVNECLGATWSTTCTGEVTSRTETCNGLDDDCNGTVDNGAGATVGCYADGDSDGYGAGALSQRCPDAARAIFGNCPSGYTNVAGDCNDGTGAVRPGATEICNGIDDDCDLPTSIDELLTASGCYVDADSDGYGAGVSGTQCRDAARAAFGFCPAGYSNVAGDCNISIAAINPGATEICNGVDDNCAGGVDESPAVSGCYADTDSDGYGAGTTSTRCRDASRGAYGFCPFGYTNVAGDCDNAVASVNPATAESCNGVDDNCAGGIDEGVRNTYYRDADGDSYGLTGTTTLACTVPAGYSVVGGDCNDGSAAIRPSAPEICNGIDDNCGGGIDEGVRPTWYRDADGDFWGAASTSTLACTQPVGYVSNSGDCNDVVAAAGAAVYPGAVERCNNIDDNCSAGIDEPPANLDCNGLYPYPGVSFSCSAGACTITACPTGSRDCNSGPVNGCETDITSDEANCGACGTNCSMICASGSCDDPTMISIGGTHACARRASGRIVCWGNGIEGQLGNSTTASSYEPVPVFGIADATTVTASLSGTPSHTCALRTGGAAWCWGANTYGALGSASTAARIEPIAVVNGSVWAYSAISAGAGHTCAICATGQSGCVAGQAFCWGLTNLGQIGNSSLLDSGTPWFDHSPAFVTGLTDAVQIGAGGRHSCARRATGAVVCWGTNEFYQLGDGLLSGHTVPPGPPPGATPEAACTASPGVTVDCTQSPVTVSGLTATELAVGGNHSCALRAGGTVVCWGRNNVGQLGNGTTINSSIPVVVSGLADAVSITAGFAHSCARRATGQVVCWGSRSSGALGDGLTLPAYNSVPVNVTGLSNATFIDAGTYANCAIRSGSAPPSRDVCWGNNFNGQLGDGTNTNRLTFVPIVPLP